MAPPTDRAEKILFDTFGYTLNKEGRDLLREQLSTLVKRKILKLNSEKVSVTKNLNLAKLTSDQIDLLVSLLNSNPYSDIIKEEYISNFKSGVNSAIFEDGVKTINNFTIILRANPHISKDNSLCREIMKTVIKWSWEPNGVFNNDIDSLAYAIKSDVDVKTIQQAISDNSFERDLARSVLEGYKEKNLLNERCSYAVEGFAAATIISVLAFGGLGDVSSAPGLLENVYNTIAADVGLEPLKTSLFTLSTALATTASLYIGARIVNKGSTWVQKIYRSFCNAMSVSSLYKDHNKRIVDKVVDSYLYQGFGYDTNCSENQKDLMTCAFLSQKHENEDLKLSNDGLIGFNIQYTNKELQVLNGLTQDQIVCLSNIENPSFQKIFLSKDWNSTESALIRNIDTWDFITTKGVYGDKKYYLNGKHYKDYSELPTLKDFASHDIIRKMLLRDDLIDQLREMYVLESSIVEYNKDSKERVNLQKLLFSLSDSVKSFIAKNQDLKLTYSNDLLEKLEKEKILISSFLVASTCGTKYVTNDMLDNLNSVLESNNIASSLNTMVSKYIKGSVNKTKQVKVWGVLKKLVATMTSEESYNNVNPYVREKLAEFSKAFNYENCYVRCLNKGENGLNPLYKVSDVLFKMRSSNNNS